MRILAFHPGIHDAAAAAYDDYHCVAAVQEERLTREKGSGGGVPYLAIDEVLRIANWACSEVDAIATTRSIFPVSYFRCGLNKEIDYAVRRWLGKDVSQRELIAKPTSEGTYAASRRSGSSVHSFGRYSARSMNA